MHIDCTYISRIITDIMKGLLSKMTQPTTNGRIDLED